MDSNGGCLPEDILFAILTMLPVKSLCRFRCISKFWLATISNPNFIASHLASSRFRPKLLVSVIDICPLQDNGICTFFSIDYPEQDINTQPLPATSCSSVQFSSDSLISTSPNGLICFPCSDGIKIGNPITGDFDVIPYPISNNTSLLFGFDPVENSHVILKLEDHDYTTYFDCGRSVVFDLVENYWHVTHPHPWLVSLDSGICIHGVIYFSASIEDFVEGTHGFKYCFYAFDVRLKCFQMIERPPDSLHCMNEFLIEYNGRLALVGNGDTRDTSMDETCLWILEDPEKPNWSFKSFVVPWKENLTKDGTSIEDLESFYSGGRKINLSGATNRGLLILATPLSRGSVYLFFYKIESKSLRRFEVDGLPENPCACKTLRFNFVTESLQSPKHLRRRRRRKKAAFINIHPPCS